jgi:hypothetical protein
MRWLEMIKLRAARSCEGLLDEFFRQMNNADREGGLVEIKTYRHAALETDLTLHLHWESKRPEQNGSILGLRLAQALKEFGLVDYSIWIEEQN